MSMPHYKFRLEGNTASIHGMELELPDESVIRPVAKQAARQLASRELVSGKLILTKNLLVFDSTDIEVARHPLTDFISVA